MEQTLTPPRMETTPEAAPVPTVASLLERLQDTVTDLAHRPVLFWALLLAVNALAMPYNGFNHDARLYGAQVMEKVQPGSFAGDLYLQYGSQDRFTIWTPLTAPLVSLVGLPVAYLILFYFSKGLFFLAAYRLVRRLLKDDTAMVLSLIVIALSPLPFGGHRTFSLNEAFLTPRIMAPAIVMFSLERMLAGRPILALGLQAFAVAVHPLMALAGLTIYFFWGLMYLLRGWRFVVALIGLIGAAALVLLVESLGTPLFGHMDEQWRWVVLHICIFIRPDLWSIQDWMAIGVAVAAHVAGAIWLLPEQARFLTAVVLAGAAGLLGTATGVGLNYLLLIQASPYRTLWPLQFLAGPLLFLAVVKLWRMGTPAARTGSLGLLLLVVPIDWEFETSVPSQVVMLMLFAVMACFYGGFMAKSAPNTDTEGAPQGWLLPSAIATFVLGFLYLCIYDLGLILIFAATPVDFQLDMHPLHKLQVTALALYKLPLLFAALVSMRWLLNKWSRPVVLAGLLLLTLAYHPLIAFVPKMAWYGEWFSMRFGHHRFVADFVKEHKPEDRKLTIYWPNDLRYHWYESGAFSYFNWVQMSGCAFDRQNAMEGKRRALLVRHFEIAELLLTAQKVPWSLPFANFFDIPIPPHHLPHEVLEALPPPNRVDLLKVCQEPGVDYIVLRIPIDDLYCATSGEFYIYDCRALREMDRH